MKRKQISPYAKLVSFKDIDERMDKFRTGDVALSCRDDVAGIFILFFTMSLVEHSAIACWADRHTYERTSTSTSTGKIVFKSRNEDDDLLMFVHITKRKMYDYYTKSYRSGLVLCSLDEFCKDNLMTVWRRGITKIVDDNVALECFKKYFDDRHDELEYENDLRTIFGVPANLVYAPYEHRKICTAMICDYLAKSYGYPFLMTDKGVPFDDNMDDIEEREVCFKLPSREFEVYRALDFQKESNESPVFESEKEEIVYGYVKKVANTTIHPFNIIYVTVVIFVAMLIMYFANRWFGSCSGTGTGSGTCGFEMGVRQSVGSSLLSGFIV